MFSLPAARRSVVERLVFASLILGGGLLWGRLIAMAATGPAPVPTIVSSGESNRPGNLTSGDNWLSLSRDLAMLAPAGYGTDVSETAPGGR